MRSQICSHGSSLIAQYIYVHTPPTTHSNTAAHHTRKPWSARRTAREPNRAIRITHCAPRPSCVNICPIIMHIRNNAISKSRRRECPRSKARYTHAKHTHKIPSCGGGHISIYGLGRANKAITPNRPRKVYVCVCLCDILKPNQNCVFIHITYIARLAVLKSLSNLMCVYV